MSGAGQSPPAPPPPKDALFRPVMAALLSYWRRQPLQLLTLVLGLALATALWSGVQAINAESRASYARAAAVLGQDQRDSLVPTGTEGGVDLADFVRLRRAGWRVAPVIEGELPSEIGRLSVLGVDFLSLPPPDATAGEAQGVIPGEEASPTYERAFAAPETLATLAPTARAALPPLTPSDMLPPGLLLTDISVVQRLLDRPGAIDRLIVLEPPAVWAPPLETLAPGLRRVAAGSARDGAQAGGVGRLADSFHLNLTAFGLLAFAVGLFIVHGAIGLAMEQRRGVFRTLRALGVPLATLIAALLVELLTLALVAGLLGVAMGYGVAAALLPDVSATLEGLYGARIAGGLSFRPVWWLGGLAVALLGTLIAAAGALAQVVRLPVLAPARPRAWAMASRGGHRVQALAGLGLLAGAAATARWGAGVLTPLAGDQPGRLLAGFALLAMLLLGAALLLPTLLGAGLSLAHRLTRWLSPGPLREWFWADTRQQLPGLSLALMALLLALAANIGVGTMVSSFRQTFTAYLDQRLAAELYVTARSDAEARAIAGWLAGRADAVLPLWRAEGRVATPAGPRAATIYGITDHTTYRRNWPVLTALPDAWDRVADGTGAMVNEQLWRQDGIGPGDALNIGGTPLAVVGVYSDFGNLEGQVLISPPALRARYPGAEGRRLVVRAPADAVAGLTARLRQRFALPPAALIDQAALKARSLRIFEQTFTVTAALNALTLSVAAFAIFTSLLTLSQMRLPQLAPVWAMGLTRRKLAMLELGRSVLLAVATFMLALPLGLLLAWVLLAVVNVAAFGWRLPMQLFPADWAILLALAVVAAVLAAAIPVRRLARTPPTTFLQVFAHER